MLPHPGCDSASAWVDNEGIIRLAARSSNLLDPSKGFRMCQTEVEARLSAVPLPVQCEPVPHFRVHSSTHAKRMAVLQGMGSGSRKMVPP